MKVAIVIKGTKYPNPTRKFAENLEIAAVMTGDRSGFFLLK
jgi:hypothetical protein